MNTFSLGSKPAVRIFWRALFLSTLLAASRLLAADDPAPFGTVQAKLAVESKQPRWLTVTLDYDYRDQSEQTPAVRFYPADHTIPPGAWQLARNSFGLDSDPGPSPVTSFEASKSFLRSVTSALPVTDKLLVLSGIGYQLDRGYSATVTNNPSMESVFQNARLGGTEGGVCGDIHTYLSQIAPQLGFDAAGTHTAYWYIDANSGGGHAVAQFRDPVTGEYYMQNYSSVYGTGQHTLQNLLEVSNRILGATFASSVESQPGRMHLYVPRQARWVSGLVADQATAALDGPGLRVSLGNRDQSVGTQYGWARGWHQFKAFAVGSSFDADEGTYSFANVGAAYTFSGSVFPGRPWLEEAGTRSTFQASALWMAMPVLREQSGQPNLRPVNWDTSTGYFGAFLSGFLRQGRTTELAEIELSGMGMSLSCRQEGRLAVDHAFASVPLHVYLARVWDLVGANGQPKTGQQVVTAYDQLGAQLRLPAGEALTFGFATDAFVLEGLDTNAGSAIRLGFDATWQTRNAGTFMVGNDWGRVTRNSRHDPFYDLPASQYAVFRWQQTIGRYSSVTVQTGYGRGPSVQPFGYFGAVTPELNNGSRLLTFRVSVHYAR
jgi:hypothetical protein